VWEEFKKFIARGNVIDLAVAVIVGGAFNQIVKSLVNDIIMPPLGLLLGRVNFADLYINLSSTPYASLAEAQAAGAPTINYGLFINAVMQFFVVSLAVFLIVRQMERLKKKPPKAPAEPTTKTCPYCYSKIPIKATRCPYCTSHLEDVPEA